MKEILKINMCKVYVNYKSSFTERQGYILVQGSCAVEVTSRKTIRIT